MALHKQEILEGIKNRRSELISAFVGIAGSFFAGMWFAQPELEGAAYVSTGSTIEPDPTVSLLILVVASNPKESPVVPIDYEVNVRTGGNWIRLLVERHTTLEQGVRVENTRKSIRPLMPGDWTGCFGGDSYLLGPGKLNLPVARDKPMVGTLRAFAPGLNLRDLAKRQNLIVTVHAVNGKSYRIKESIDARPDSIVQQLVGAGKWTEGITSCLK